MKKIKLNGENGKGRFAIVDDELHQELEKYSWSLTKHGYCEAHISSLNKVCRIHRVVMGVADVPGKGTALDHINRNKLDNRKCNLRFATPQQNMWNVGKAIIPTTSKYKGVRWRKDMKMWSVQCKRISGGCYDDEILAAKVYNTIAEHIYGEFAYLNNVGSDDLRVGKKPNSGDGNSKEGSVQYVG